jgi:glycosyltransferase involved in cell wall biosynthesis
VITTTDAGGPNEFVVDGVNGYSCEPEPAALGDAIARLDADRRLAASMGDAGHARAAEVTWAGVIERLVGDQG